jgi:hypothetical protein
LCSPPPPRGDFWDNSDTGTHTVMLCKFSHMTNVNITNLTTKFQDEHEYLIIKSNNIAGYHWSSTTLFLLGHGQVTISRKFDK